MLESKQKTKYLINNLKPLQDKQTSRQTFGEASRMDKDREVKGFSLDSHPALKAVSGVCYGHRKRGMLWSS